jgi:hypothetical protein
VNGAVELFLTRIRRGGELCSGRSECTAQVRPWQRWVLKREENGKGNVEGVLGPVSAEKEMMAGQQQRGAAT